VTASHNPIDYNGMKIVKSGSRPLDDGEDFQPIKKLASSQDWQEVANTGTLRDVSTVARERYVDRVLSLLEVENLKPLRIVVNSGKRTAFVTSVTFLRLNGWRFITEPADGIAFMENLASDVVSEEQFKNWLKRSSTQIK